MWQTVFVMVGSGLAGMLLFAVGAKGSLAAMLVTYLTPLPIMTAALGWGHLIGLAAGLLGTVLLGLLIDPYYGLVYGAAFALPAWWLAYLGLLARFVPITGAKTEPQPAVQREWYPVGKLMLWAASIGFGIATVGVLLVSGTSAGFEIAVQSMARHAAPVIDTLFASAGGLPEGITAAEIAAVLVHTLPIAGAASLTLIMLVNLWLAGRAVDLSHRLPRPWPDLPENLRLPRVVLAVFPVLVAGAALLDGYAGLFCAIASATLTVLLTLQGLAIVHALTRRRPGRAAILIALYAALVFLMPWSAMLLALLGLLDLAVSLRDRFAVAPSSPLNPE
jgi:hypothetical protein